MSVEVFGQTKSGEPVRAVSFAGGGVSARLMEWGATLLDLRLDGVDRPLTLGFDRFEAYEASGQHMGAIAGRFAGRIAGGFTLDGQRHDTTRNDGEATLHGGDAGFGVSLWRLIDHGDDYAELALTQPDGTDGFPGAITARCRYECADGALRLTLTATTDTPTICNLAQHSYFNLSGAQTIDDHHLTLRDCGFTPLDQHLLPTGTVVACPDEIDFSAPRQIGGAMLDGHFVLATGRRQSPTPAAVLSGGDVELSIETTEPGMVVYTSDKLPTTSQGVAGHRHGPRSGICLESQLWPDAPNHPSFPSARITADAPYRQQTVFHLKTRPTV